MFLIPPLYDHRPGVGKLWAMGCIWSMKGLTLACSSRWQRGLAARKAPSFSVLRHVLLYQVPLIPSRTASRQLPSLLYPAAALTFATKFAVPRCCLPWKLVALSGKGKCKLPQGGSKRRAQSKESWSTVDKVWRRFVAHEVPRLQAMGCVS